MVRLFPRLTGVPGPAVLTALILKDTHGKGLASEFSVMARGQVGALPQLWCLLHCCIPQNVCVAAGAGGVLQMLRFFYITAHARQSEMFA